MTLLTFVLTVKYAKEYLVSETYKITSKFNASVHENDEIESIAESAAKSRLHSAF